MAKRLAPLLASVLLLGCPSSGTIEHETDHDDGELTKLAFDPAQIETVTGEVLNIDPYQHIERSRAGVRILLKSGEQTYYVYLAPAKYLEDEKLELARGQTVEVTGSVLEGDGRAVIIAESITHAGTKVALRDDQGHPQWRKWRLWKREAAPG